MYLMRTLIKSCKNEIGWTYKEFELKTLVRS